MHPAYSVIFFTTASGAGLGLLVWLGLFNAFGMLPKTSGFGFAAMALSLGLIGAGLLSSTLHLGRPERFLKAFSQWRSSWLSREGVAAMATFVPAGLLGIGWVFLGQTGGIFALMGLSASVLALVTIYTTAMIYRSLPPIRQWHNGLVVPSYFMLGLGTGAVLLVALTAVSGAFKPSFGWLAALLTAAAFLTKSAYWKQIDTEKPASTIATATGLGAFAKEVRMFEAPHTEENFVMREMGYRVARSHVEKLRGIARVTLFAVPLVLILLTLVAPPALAVFAALAAVLSAGVGVGVERWLFFAEATHNSLLYYER